MPKPKPKQATARPQQKPKAQPMPDPWSVPETETEKSNPATEEPNPLRGPTIQAAPLPETSPNAAPLRELPNEPPPERVTTEQATPVARLALGALALVLDPQSPPTDAEVAAVAEPAAEGLPAWLFAWWLRLGGALAAFALKRIEARQQRLKDAQPEPGTLKAVNSGEHSANPG